MEYHLEPHEHRKKAREEREGKKSGFLNLILLQLILCVLTAIIILFGNLIFSGSVNRMKEYYVANILNDNSLKDTAKSAIEQVMLFLNQPASNKTLSDSSSSSSASSDLGSSSRQEESSQTSDSSGSNASSETVLGSATGVSSAGGEFNPAWEQTTANFNPAPLNLGQKEAQKTCVPLHGVLSCGYGYRLHPITGLPDFHKGIDIPADEGTPILAAMDGTVMTAGVSASFGNYVVIQHSDSLVTRYGHCSRLNVEQGQEVQAGDIVGFVGNTGYSTGKHLHFDVSRNGTYFDPHQLFPSFE